MFERALSEHEVSDLALAAPSALTTRSVVSPRLNVGNLSLDVLSAVFRLTSLQALRDSHSSLQTTHIAPSQHDYTRTYTRTPHTAHTNTGDNSAYIYDASGTFPPPPSSSTSTYSSQSNLPESDPSLLPQTQRGVYALLLQPRALADLLTILYKVYFCCAFSTR